MSDPSLSQKQPTPALPPKKPGWAFDPSQFVLGIMLGLGLTILVPVIVTSIVATGEGLGAAIGSLVFGAASAVLGPPVALVILAVTRRGWMATGLAAIYLLSLIVLYSVICSSSGRGGWMAFPFCYH